MKRILISLAVLAAFGLNACEDTYGSGYGYYDHGYRSSGYYDPGYHTYGDRDYYRYRDRERRERDDDDDGY